LISAARDPRSKPAFIPAGRWRDWREIAPKSASVKIVNPAQKFGELALYGRYSRVGLAEFEHAVEAGGVIPAGSQVQAKRDSYNSIAVG
jgi:hypothetical protein